MKLFPYLVWPLLSLLSGCASTGQDSQRLAELEQQLTELNTQVEQMKSSIAQWQQVAPQVNELLSIEQDLNLLSTQLQLALAPTESQSEVMVAQISKPPGIVEQDSNTTKAGAEQQAANAQPNQPIPATPKKEAVVEHHNKAEFAVQLAANAQPNQPIPATPKKEAVVEHHNKAEFAVQLAATRKQSQLKMVHRRLLQDYPALRKHPVNVEQVEVKGQRYFRLKLGAFERKEQGRALCAELKPFHPQCLLSHYTDNPVTL